MDIGGYMIIGLLMGILILGVIGMVFNIKWIKFMNYYQPILDRIAEEELLNEVMKTG